MAIVRKRWSELVDVSSELRDWGTQYGTHNPLTLPARRPTVIFGGRPRARNAYPGRDRSPPLSRSFPTRAPAASAASSAGAGSLSGPRRSRTLTTRIALPIARNPRATARPQPCWASRPDDRSNGERTCSVPNDRTTALVIWGWSARSLDAAIHQPFDPELRSAHPPSQKGGMPGREST